MSEQEPRLGLHVFIGEVELSPEALLGLTWERKSTDTHWESHLRFSVRADAQDLGLVDYSQMARLETENSTTGERIKEFAGWVTCAHVTPDGLQVQVEAEPDQAFREGKMTGCPPSGLTGVEWVEFMFQQSGLSYRIDLPGWVPNTERHTFAVVMPVAGMLGLAVPLDVLGVRLYAACGGLAEDGVIDQMLQKADPAVAPAWPRGGVRSRVYVAATTHHEAMRLARPVIQRALDWLTFRQTLAVASYPSGSGTIALPYRRESMFPALKLTGWAYARDTDVYDKAKSVIWHTERPLGDETLAVDARHDYWRGAVDVVSGFLDLPRDAMSRHERAVADCLRWLARAHTDADPLDALSDLWTALEFLLSSEVATELFSKPQTKAIRRTLETARGLDLQAEGALDWISSGQWERLSSMLGEWLNRPSVRTQFRLFCRHYGVRFHPSDIDFMWKDMRPKRNNLAHGANSSVSRDELRRMAAMLQRMVLAKASSLTSSGERPSPWPPPANHAEGPSGGAIECAEQTPEGAQND